LQAEGRTALTLRRFERPQASGLSLWNPITKPLWITALAVLILDRVTKMWAVAALTDQPPRDFIGSILRLHLIGNAGAAFSVGMGRSALLSAFAFFVIGAIIYFATSLVSKRWALTLGLVLGGALGNLFDRVTQSKGGFLQGEVIDFLELPHWPIFNLADMAVSTAAVLAIILSIKNIAPTDKRPDRRLG
jgi:signal peptidase II